MTGIEQLVESLSRELAHARVPHAFGGAIALAYWAPPRATFDIDLKVFVDHLGLEAAVEAFEVAGFPVEPDVARFAAGRFGEFRLASGAGCVRGRRGAA